MKMKATRILSLLGAAAASAALLASCERMEPEIETTDTTEEVITNVRRNAEGNVLVPFSVETGAPATRVEMNGSTSNIVYSAGDKLLIYNHQTGNPILPSLLTLADGAGTKSGKFSGSIVLKDGKTEADFQTWIATHNEDLEALVVPAAGLSEGVFSWDDSNHKLSIDYTTNSLDCDLEALVGRTILYHGNVNYTAKKITEIKMWSSYVKMNVTVPNETHWNDPDIADAGKYDVEVSYKGEYSGYPFLTPTVTLDASNINCPEGFSVTGQFSLTSATSGTLYMALLASNYIRAFIDDNYWDHYEDLQGFTFRMTNIGKGYTLTDGEIVSFVIESGKGYTKSVTLSAPASYDVLDGQPASVRSTFLTSTNDKNSDGKLSLYEAAQIDADNFPSGLAGNTDLTDASFLRYFTGLRATKTSSFQNCTNLTKVIIPKNIQEISSATFNGCTALTDVLLTLNDKLETINVKAFYGCSSLNSFSSIPNSLKSIGETAFAYSGLVSIFLDDTAITKVNSNAFSSCSALKYVYLPNAVEEIGSYAFSGCSALDYFTAPSSLVTIGAFAFSKAGIKTLTLNEGLTKISNNAFQWCANLTSVTMPASLTEIGENAFMQNTSLETVTFKGTTAPTFAHESDGKGNGAYYTFVRGDATLLTFRVPSSALEVYMNRLCHGSSTFSNGSTYNFKVVAD